MSYRSSPGTSGQHNPMLAGIEEYNKDKVKKEQFNPRNAPRGTSMHNVLDGPFPMESYEPYGKEPKSVFGAAAIVVGVLIVIVLACFLIHEFVVKKHDKLAYLENFKLWGADVSELEPIDYDEPVEVIEEAPANEVLQGGNANANADVYSLMNEKKRNAYII